ncbi:hypothetical protein FQZ97_1008110 [compost metagenome]
MTSTGFSGLPSGVVRPVITATGSTQGTSRRASLRSMWYSCRATCSDVSLMAITEPPRWANRTMCREMPRGRAARYSAGQSSSATCHGRSRSSGSAEAAVMLRLLETLEFLSSLALAASNRGSLPIWP